LTKGITFKKEYIPISQSKRIIADAENPKYKENPRELWTAYMEEWQYSGASCVPTDITTSQHAKFFSDLTFESITTFLDRVKSTAKA
jgi:swainsonine biosynthesis oxidoreductase SwnR